MSVMRSDGRRRPQIKSVQSSDTTMRRMSLPALGDGNYASTPAAASRPPGLCAMSVDREAIPSLGRRMQATHTERNSTPSNPRNLLPSATLPHQRQLRSKAVESCGSVLTPTRAVESQAAQSGKVRISGQRSIAEENGLQRMEPISEGKSNLFSNS